MVSSLVSSVRNFLSMLARWSRSLFRIKRCLLSVSSSAISLEMRAVFHFVLVIICFP